MAHPKNVLITARHLFGLISPRSLSSTRVGWQRRTIIDARRIASPQSLIQVDRLAEYTRDEQIDARTVRVKSEAGELGQQQDLRAILRNIDRNTHTVVQLAAETVDRPAVVQIYEKLELLKQVRENERRTRQQVLAARDKKPKQLELNWAISNNDLELKLKQLATFLEKGKKVEILLASKKKQRRATPEEGTTVLKRIREKLAEVGAKEISVMEGQVLKQATMTVKKSI